MEQGNRFEEKKKGGRQWHMNQFNRLDGEGVGSGTESSNFPAWANRRIAHMGPEFR